MHEEVSVFIEFELTGDSREFEAIFRQIIDLSQSHGANLRYDFFKADDDRRIFALEVHPNARSLAEHFDRALPLMQQAWACARPLRTLILGNVPDEMRAHMEAGGVTVIPHWIGS